MKIYINKIAMITLAFALVFSFTGCGATNKTTTKPAPVEIKEVDTPVQTQNVSDETPVPDENKDELSCNLSYVLTYSKNHTIMCIKNTNSVDVDVLFGIEYYDGDTYLDHFENSVTAVKANGETYVTLRNPRDFEGTIDDEFYNKCKITLKATHTESTKNYNDQLVINVLKHDINNETYELADIEVTNNSEFEMSGVDLITLFYKGDTLVGTVATPTAEIPLGETVTSKLLVLTTGENLEIVDYDTYEVLIQDSHIK